MTENELTELRRANPVDVEDVADLVAAHRSLLAEAIEETTRRSSTPLRSVAPVTSRASDLRVARADRDDRRRTRFGLIGAIAASIAIASVPVLFFAASRNDSDVDDTRLPTVDEVPTVTVPGPPDDDSSSVREDEVFVPVPSSTPDSPAPATTTRPSTTPSIPTTTTFESDAAVDVVPAPPPASSPSLPATTPATTEVSSPAPSAPSPGSEPVGTTTPATTITPATVPSTAPASTAAPTSSAPTTTSAPIPANDAKQPFDPARDLLVVTLDFANRDDGHATVAARELATSLGIEPLVVAGTPAPESSSHVQEYVTVVSAAWGSGWLDAGGDRQGVVAAAADRWLRTIDGGGVVRVAEGGVSDFTAEVLREVRNRRPALDTAVVVQVVHHNQRNEDETRSGDLDFVRSNATYVRVDDGNSANDTADLKMVSAAFESAALAGRHAAAWTVAFDYLPADSLDFSDTVTALHVVGVATDQVADPDGFAATFML